MSKLETLQAYVRGMPSWFAMSRNSSYLRTTGWLKSRALQMPRDVHGEPIPWITYPSLFFLEQRVRAEMSVFEFGSGSSTLWWSRRVRRLVSCEHDKVWFEKMRSIVPEFVEISHVSMNEQQYSREVLKYQHTFDIIVIDGRDRVNCARNAVAALKPQGVILWDNSDRAEYRAGYELLERNYFRRLDFAGMGPLNICQWTTSVFYREQNCFGL